jgi:hypothetical protein
MSVYIESGSGPHTHEPCDCGALAANIDCKPRCASLRPCGCKHDGHRWLTQCAAATADNTAHRERMRAEHTVRGDLT